MATTSAQMVTLIRDALAATPAAVLTVTVDGQSVTYSRSQALSELEFWEKRAAKEAGKRPRVSSINLSGGFNR